MFIKYTILALFIRYIVFFRGYMKEIVLPQIVSVGIYNAQIAYECGFSSQSYFSYAFKRSMRYPPREYAKKIVAHYNDK